MHLKKAALEKEKNTHTQNTNGTVSQKFHCKAYQEGKRFFKLGISRNGHKSLIQHLFP